MVSVRASAREPSRAESSHGDLQAIREDSRLTTSIVSIVTHVALLRPYDVVYTAPGTVVTEFFFTRESPSSSYYEAKKQKLT